MAHYEVEVTLIVEADNEDHAVERARRNIRVTPTDRPHAAWQAVREVHTYDDCARPATEYEPDVSQTP